MSVLREVLARFGIETDSKPVKELEDGVDGLISKLKHLGGLLAEGLAVEKLTEFVVEMSEVGDEIAKTSQRLGLSTTSLQAWRHAAQLSGIGAEELDGALGILQRTLSGAVTGNKEAASTFSQLGVKVKDAHGQIRSLDDLLPDIAEGFRKQTNPTLKAGLAMKIFGRSGARLLPLLNEGAEGVDQLRGEFQDLGGGMEAETVKQSEELNDELDRMKLSIFSVKSRIAGVLIPYMAKLVDMFTKAVGAVLSFTKETHVIEAALVVLGAVATAMAVKVIIAFFPLIATAAAIALGIGFIVLVVDDLITLFTGGKSVIGAFIDEMFGAGTAAQVVKDLKDAWEGMLLVIHDATKAVKEFFGVESEPEPPKTPPEVQKAIDRDKQARAAAEAGTMTRNPDESWDQAKARFYKYRGEGIQAGRVAATQSDVDQGLAGRVGYVKPSRGGGKTTHVNAPTKVDINVPPGTDAAQRAAIKRAVDDSLDQRNRQVAAAMVQETADE